MVGRKWGEGKNSIGNLEAKELICMTHGHELKGGNVGGRGCAGQTGIKGRNGTTVIAESIKYIFLKKKLAEGSTHQGTS